MGIKLLILQACLIAGEEIAEHAAVGAEVEVQKDDASYLTRAGRALYLDRSDDPTKGTLTATSDDRSRVSKQAKAIAATAQTTAVAAAPVDPAAGIAEAIAQGIAAGLAAAGVRPASPVAGT